MPTTILAILKFVVKKLHDCFNSCNLSLIIAQNNIIKRENNITKNYLFPFSRNQLESTINLKQNPIYRATQGSHAQTATLPYGSSGGGGSRGIGGITESAIVELLSLSLSLNAYTRTSAAQNGRQREYRESERAGQKWCARKGPADSSRAADAKVAFGTLDFTVAVGRSSTCTTAHHCRRKGGTMRALQCVAMVYKRGSSVSRA